MSWERFRRELEAIGDPERRADWARQILARFQRELSEDPPGWLLAAAGSRALAERDELRPPPRRPRLTAETIRRQLAQDRREARLLALAIEGLRKEIVESRRGYEERLAMEEAIFDRDFEERFGDALVIGPPADQAEAERRVIAARLGMDPRQVI